MKTIAVVCEKGGTGKSVIANELYESYVRQGVPASLYSLDGQYKQINWKLMSQQTIIFR